MLRRLLLLPVLAPLLALLIVAALNPRPATSLRMLTWRSPPLPLGLWIALAGGGGALLSAGAAGLALRQGSSSTARTAADSGRWPQERRSQERWQQERGHQESSEQADRPERQPLWEAQSPRGESSHAGGISAGGSRAPGEPPPTVSVPFRVVRRGAVADPASAAASAPRPRAAWQERQPEPMPADDDWNGDWTSQAGDDW